MRQLGRKAIYRVGHRGSFLMLFGLAVIFYALAIVFEPSGFLIYPSFILPWHTWVIVWIGVGIVSIIGAFRRVDKWSFALSATASALWSFRWFHVVLLAHSSGAWTTAITWLVIAGIVTIISTWPEVHVRYDYIPPNPEKLDMTDPP